MFNLSVVNIVPDDRKPALEHLNERLMLDGNVQVNWQSSLNELNLVTVQGEV